ncbi:MAG: substrate-binding domain-containing protein, partial [Luminiphilus sp.]
LPEGYRFVIAPVDDDVSFRETLEDFAARRARAAIVIPPAEGIAIDPRLTAEMPIASLLSPCQGKGVRPFLPDEVETGRRAAEHLLAHGHTRLLHLTYRRESPAIRDRASGFITTLQKAGAEGGVLDDLSPETIVASVKKRKVTACFCHNDWLALTAQRALHAAGLRIPEEVSLLGVDDSPTFVSLCPEISTLHYPAESIAAAIQVWLTGKKPPTIEPAWVVARKTVRRIG